MKLLNEFLLSLTNGYPVRGVYTLPLYNKNRLSIVPMVNPDGVDLVLNGPSQEQKEKLIAMNGGSSDFSGWKANIRGIDLITNFRQTGRLKKKEKNQKPCIKN